MHGDALADARSREPAACLRSSAGSAMRADQHHRAPAFTKAAAAAVRYRRSAGEHHARVEGFHARHSLAAGR